MVKAAIKRGVYFEITYSHLVSDAHIRRQMLSTAKLLVDWTRGKNLIFSSGASSVNELRGPYDVMNISSLLGLSMERAKVTISRNCRSLLTNALRRKQCYKEAIRVEKFSPSQPLDTKEPWFVDWSNWDPISSGEGDLPALDDVTKFFSASERTSKSFNEIKFGTVSDGMLPNRSSNNEGDLMSLDERGPLIHVTKECESSIAANESPYQDRFEVLAEDEILLHATPLQHQQFLDNEGDLSPPPDFGKLFPSDENSKPVVTVNKDPEKEIMLPAAPLEHQLPDKEGNLALSPDFGKFPSYKNSDAVVTGNQNASFENKFDIVYAEDEEPLSGNLPSTCNPANKYELMSLNDKGQLFSPESVMPSGVYVSENKSSSGADSFSVVRDTQAHATSLRDMISCSKDEVPPKDITRPFGNLMDIDSSSFSNKDAAQDVPEVQNLAKVDRLEKENPFMSVYDILFQKDFAKSGMVMEDERIPFPDSVRFNEPYVPVVQNQRDLVSASDGMPSKEILLNMEDEEASAVVIGSQQNTLKLGKAKFKRTLTHRGLPFLSKHFIHHLPFKKKVVQSKGSIKNLVRRKRENCF